MSKIAACRRHWNRERPFQTGSIWRLAVVAVGLGAALAASAPAVTIEWNYDGTYNPTSNPPPAGQSTWTVYTSGGLAIVPDNPVAGVANFTDASTTGRIEMKNFPISSLDPATLGYVPDVTGADFEYSIRMSLSYSGTSGATRTFFGLKDEGITSTGTSRFGLPRNMLFAHSSTAVNLFYVVDTGGAVMGTNLYTTDETHPTLGNNVMHDYRMVRRKSGNVMVLDFYLDNVLVDTRPYSAFKRVSTTNGGTGIWTTNGGTSDYVIDSVHFAMTVPEPVVPTTQRQVSDVFRYNGTYNPDSITPPAGQTTWNLVATGSLTPTTAFRPNTPTDGLMTLADTDTAGRAAMNHAITDAAFIASPDEYEWEYHFTMALNSLSAGIVMFGLRDEGGSGRSVTFGHSATGDLYYCSIAGTAPATTDYLYTAGVDGPGLNDSLMHTYRVVKNVKVGIGIDVLFYLDNALIDTRNYYSFAADDTDSYVAADNGFGMWSSTPGLANYVIDDVFFGVPEPSTTVLMLAGLLLLGLRRRIG